MPRTTRGFTLIELVMVILLSGLVLVMIGAILSRPLQGLSDQSRRVELVDLASGALSRMSRDIRLAIPNSLRTSGTQTFELLAISEAGRYRANLPGGLVRSDPPACPGSGACQIQVLSPGVSATGAAAAQWMVVYNIGSSDSGSSVWPPINTSAAGTPAVITPNGGAFSLASGVLSVTGIAGFRFKHASPQHRFYLAREVVGFTCSGVGTDSSGTGTGTIRRASFSTLASSYGYTAANSALLVDSVASCSFSYDPGSNLRGGLVTLSLGLAKGGEVVTLLQQVHVDNAP
ncbi:PulJ/GspJ family protein [Pseudomonas sp. LRF_L74]|uniref:PulJ/GspJ family protein n=1 Tax=Pseudomonas sp. LRF_L74 TaxID=3369422 RepID=UPI003F61C698